ncbi:MAG: hypothetical protein HY280_09745, partial [Nitrospinae bacterium]|nr:hypothetical protein [Nitrospinota bacterium]
MERALIAGPKSLLDSCLKFLHTEKVVHVANPALNKIIADLGFKTGGHSQENLETAERLLFETRGALQTLLRHSAGRTDILSFETPAGLDWLEKERVQNITEICDKVSKTQGMLAGYLADLDGVAEHKKNLSGSGLTAALNETLKFGEATAVDLPVGDGCLSEQELDDALKKSLGEAYCVFRTKSDRDSVSLVVVYPKRFGEKV